jgi:aryl-alcohol dehydrogenase-like predicted oxidoreductase
VTEAYAASRAAGLSLFDTAEAYGRGTSETLLGGMIRDEVSRDGSANIRVATKFSPYPWRAGRGGPLRRALAASLDRLGQPRVELYQLHFPLPVLSGRTWLHDLAAAQQDGLVGAVGVSNYGPRDLRTAHQILADQGVALATNQVEYSLLTRKPERSGLVELCAELGVTIIAYSPLAQGLLTGKYTPANPPPGIRRLRYRRRRLTALAPLIERLTAIGAKHGGRTPGQVALNWVIARGAVPIPGAKTAEQARHNAGGAGWSLSPTEVGELSALGGR